MNRVYAGVFLAVVGIDQLSKFWFWRGVLNTGGVFGIGEGWKWEILMAGGLMGLAWWFWRSEVIREKMGLTIMIASGLSNMIDRYWFSGVRDFIRWPILNVYGNGADLMLFFGVIWLVWSDLAVVYNKHHE